MATDAAVRQFQSDEGLEVDGLVDAITWPVLLEGPVIGSDDDGHGTVEPWEIPAQPDDRVCSTPAPPSDAWSGEEREIVDTDTGALDPAPFNEFLRTAGPPVSTTPCDAAQVLLHLDRPRDDGVTVLVVVDPAHAADTTVTVTLEHLADDSVGAVRYVLRFERQVDDTIQLTSGAWSQRCQPGRGHDDFSTELCV